MQVKLNNNQGAIYSVYLDGLQSNKVLPHLDRILNESKAKTINTIKIEHCSLND